jgi:prepilin-type N-terminal cleavage/methylation domain-containing protein
MAKKRGFTLIELLVVISIIGTLVGLIVNNMADARARARDAKRKSGLNQLKTGLRLYYNDFQIYPNHASGNSDINGCIDGAEACGGPGNPLSITNTIYMKELPEFDYYEQTDSGDGFLVKVTLENASDPDLTTSQTSCGGTHEPTDYIACAD